MSPEEQKRRDKIGQTVAETALGWAGDLVDSAVDQIPKSAPKITRYVARSAARGPGIVYEVVKIASAKDKGRAVAGALGGVIGGAGGAAMGPAAIVASPAGAAVGSAAGEEFGERMYDAHAAKVGAYAHKVDEDLRRGVGTAKQWVAGAAPR